jgi:hypothetical protein
MKFCSIFLEMHELGGDMTSTLEQTNKEDQHTPMEQKDGGNCALTIDYPSTRENIVVKDDHVVAMVKMFESSHDFHLHVNSNKQT